MCDSVTNFICTERAEHLITSADSFKLILRRPTLSSRTNCGSRCAFGSNQPESHSHRGRDICQFAGFNVPSAPARRHFRLPIRDRLPTTPRPLLHLPAANPRQFQSPYRYLFPVGADRLPTASVGAGEPSIGRFDNAVDSTLETI